MSPSLWQITLCVSALLAVSYCSAQQMVSHAPSAETSSALLYSSSRTALEDGKSGADASPGNETVSRQRPAYPVRIPWFYQRFSVGGFVTPLGIGLGGAMAITRSTDIRVAHNFFSYSLAGTSNDIGYTGKLHFGSMQANFDWSPGTADFISVPASSSRTTTTSAETGECPATSRLR